MNRIKYPWLKKYVEHFDINKLAHSHLLSGKTGIGKLHFTEELSKSLLCSNSNELFEYCNDCSSCKAFNAGSHPDFKLIDKETESKIIKISQLRGNSKETGDEGILNISHETPLLSKSKIIVINSAESMNLESQNFLLKTLEEPSKNTFIFLISSKPFSFKPTLLSRLNHTSFSFPNKTDISLWIDSLGIELNSKDLNFFENLNLTEINQDQIKNGKEERKEFSSELSESSSSKKLEKIASNWDDQFLSIKLGWLSKIILQSIFVKINKTEIPISYFSDNILHLSKTKNLTELFALSNELNILSKDLSEGINLNNKIQIKALLSTF